MANLKFKRGTKGAISFSIKGDHTGRELSFVVKQDNEISSARLIQKLKSLSEISVVYDDETGLTTCEVSLEKTDTQDLSVQYYPWDVDSISLSDQTDIETPEGGLFQLLQDVQTPFDGFATPENAVRFIQIDASSASVGDILQVSISSDDKKVVGIITLAELKRQLENL
jgi:hypothetical protein